LLARRTECSINMSSLPHVSLPSSPSAMGLSEPSRERVAVFVGKEDRVWHCHVLSLPRIVAIVAAGCGPGAAMSVGKEI
jgi:hypothetical protein